MSVNSQLSVIICIMTIKGFYKSAIFADFLYIYKFRYHNTQKNYFRIFFDLKDINKTLNHSKIN